MKTVLNFNSDLDEFDFSLNFLDLNSKSHFYHGTTSFFEFETKDLSSNPNAKSVLLPPNQTNVLRENFRKKDLDVVFITTSFHSAKQYAKKACKTFGGTPIVLRVEPFIDSNHNHEYNQELDLFHVQHNEFICNGCKILEIIEI